MFNSKDEIITFVQLLINVMSSDKLKIVHVEDRFHPDMGYQLNFTAKYYNKDKFEMHIITSESLKLWSHDKNLTKKVIEQKDKDFLKKHGVQIHRLPVIFEKTHRYNLLMKNVLKKIYEISPDILFVHAVESYTSFLLLKKNKLYNDFLVCTDTHTLKSQFRNSPTEKFYFSIFNLLVLSKLKRYNSPFFYTMTENKNIIEQQYGIDPKNIFSYSLGADDEIFFPDKQSGKKLRKKLDIDENKKIVLYTGKFNFPKNPHLLIEAMKTIENDLPETVLILVGGKNKEYFDKYFTKKPEIKNTKIIILDAVKVTELNSFYNMADIVVFPTENTLSNMDSQLAGTPVIMQDDFTNREKLKYGGIMFKEGDINDMGEKILNLLNDDTLREKLGQSGHNYIVKNFSYRNIVKNMEETILNKLNRK